MAAPALAHRTFSLDDQRAFARLSGDWNPLHVDPIAARRTMFEQPVVHGVHLLLWALDRWFARGDTPVTLASLKATFRKPAFLATEIVLEASERDHAVQLVGTAGTERVLDATLAWSSAPALASELPATSWSEEPPVFVARDAIATTRGSVALAVDPMLAHAMFPHVLARLGGVVLAELLATTRVVGMLCPGLHSIFGALDLKRVERAEPVLDYEVTRANLKYSMVDLAIRARSLAGTLATYYRPVPVDGPTNDEIGAQISPTAFAGQRALVVGGTRGLGEAIARCLAFGGADVCITYHRGAADAKRVAERTRSAATRGRISVRQLDITQPVDLGEIAPTHLYYLATPRIPGVGRYSRALFEEMLRYYVDGLLAVVEAASPSLKMVWAPSTIFLTDGGGHPSYAMAKAAMEQLCQRLPAMFSVRAHAPRLGRIATDQTIGLIQIEAPTALAVAVRELTDLG